MFLIAVVLGFKETDFKTYPGVAVTLSDVPGCERRAKETRTKQFSAPLKQPVNGCSNPLV